MSASPVAAPPEPKLRVVITSATDVGGRTGNEDAVLVRDLPAVGVDTAEGHLLAVADGMGGYQRGEIASQMAIDVISAAIADDPGGDMALLMKQAFRRANEDIFAGGQGAEPPQMMGTTLVACATRGKYATIASIGDSRAYLIRANRLTQITKDHSLVADQVARGEISEDQARESPHRNILTHAIGQKAKLDSKMPNIFEITLLPEDKLFLCTDGFYDVLDNDELLAALTTGDSDNAARALVDLAVERGTSDNVTAIVATVLPIREPELITSGAGKGGVPLYMLGVAALVILIIIIAILALT